jgi:hypothetical protein
MVSVVSEETDDRLFSPPLYQTRTLRSSSRSCRSYKRYAPNNCELNAPARPHARTHARVNACIRSCLPSVAIRRWWSHDDEGTIAPRMGPQWKESAAFFPSLLLVLLPPVLLLLTTAAAAAAVVQVVAAPGSDGTTSVPSEASVLPPHERRAVLGLRSLLHCTVRLGPSVDVAAISWSPS